MKLKNSLATFALLGLSTWHSHAFEARVLVLEKCPVNNSTKQIEEAGALGVALLAKLVGAVAGTAIDGLVSALSDVKKVSAESAERLPGWYSKVQGSETVTINPNLVCVVTLVAPELSNRNETADAAPSEKLYDEIAKTLTEPKSERAHRRMRSGAATLAKYGVVGPPSFYMESIFVKNASGTVFALQPAFVYYPRFLGEKVTFGPDTRDILLQLEFSEPGSTTAFASTKLEFNGLKESKLTDERVSGLRLPWSKSPSAGSSKVDSGLVTPFNVRFLFTESAQPGKLGKIVGGVVKDQKASIVTAIENETKLAVSATERQAARNAAAESANSALTTYLAAYDQNEVAIKARSVAMAGTDQAAIQRTTNAAALTAIRLKNAETLAKAAFESADVPFVSIPPTSP